MTDALQSSETGEHRHFFQRLRIIALFSMGSILLFMLLWQALSILPLIFAGILVGVFLTNGSYFITQKTRLPYVFAFILLVLFVFVLLISSVMLLAPTLYEQVNRLINDLPNAWQAVEGYLQRFGWGEEILQQLENATAFFWSENVDKGIVVSEVASVFSGTFNALLSIFIILLIGIYIAAEPELYRNGLLKLVPPRRRERAKAILNRLSHVLIWWFFGQSLSMLILGILMTIGLWLLDIPFALALGLLTALMTFIPNLGPLLAAIPTLVIALGQDPMQVLYVIILTLIIQNIEGALITPFVHRHLIAMPPALIIAVQILLASMIGFIGVVLAMPLIACSMVLVQMLYIEDILGERHY
jgi:predicted PurR-regulated permease PerM